MQFTIVRECVYHVGSMRKSDKAKDSYEGTALSVSKVPDAWREIAQLGADTPLWELTRPGARFIDVLAVLKRPALRTAVMAWAQAQGYIKWTECWRLTIRRDAPYHARMASRRRCTCRRGQ